MGRGRGPRRRSLAALIGALSCVVATVALPKGTAAASADNPQIRQAMAIARPAVVFLYVQIQGSLLDHRDNQVHGPYISSSKGSGFFVNPDGDIATATHVVSPTATDVKTALVDRYIIAVTGNQLPSNNPSFQGYMQSTDVQNVSFDVRVITQAMHIPGNATNDDLERLGLPATIVASSPVDATDVSVIHVNRSAQPSLLLRSGVPPKNNESLALMGYPQMAPTFSVVPDVDYGLLTDVQSTASINAPGVADLPRAATVFVTSAYSEHGDSGGPGIDTQARAVGLVSFGALSGTPIFLVSADNIAAVLAQGHVANVLGDADQKWRAGAAAQQRGDVSAALADYRACAAASPDNTGCAHGIAQLTSTKGSGGPPLALIIGGAAALLVIVALTAVLFLRRPESELD
jgi:hypothetical protein